MLLQRSFRSCTRLLSQRHKAWPLKTSIENRTRGMTATTTGSRSLPSTVENVKLTCRAVSEQADCAVCVNTIAIDKFLALLTPDELHRIQTEGGECQKFPLQFQDEDSEIDFVSVLNLLNFGSGFRRELHAQGGRGAYETILYGVFGMYLAGNNFTSEALRSITLAQDEQVMPGVYMSKPGPLRPLAEMIHQTLNEAGQILGDNGYRDFAAFVRQKVLPEGNSNSPSALALVKAFAETFPAFDDRAVCRGREVIFLKKAQILAADLYLRFRQSDPSTFGFSDAHELTIFPDNVVPCVLRANDILQLSPDLARKVDTPEDLPAGDEESELRAASVVACEELVRKSEGKFTAMQLDYYLWKVGKDPKYRPLHRHSTKDTRFY